jgi:hypothetical protein
MKSVVYSLLIVFTSIFGYGQVKSIQMERSGPVSIDIPSMSTVSINESSMLLAVELILKDLYIKDYSNLTSSSDLSFNFNDSIIDFVNTVSATRPANIRILKLEDNLKTELLAGVGEGKTTLLIPVGYEPRQEELRKLVRLVRTKDGRLAAMVTFDDIAGQFSSLHPDIKGRICLMVPLGETTPSKAIQLAKDDEGKLFALLKVQDGSISLKMKTGGTARINVSVLTPSDPEVAEQIGFSMIVLN